MANECVINATAVDTGATSSCLGCHDGDGVSGRILASIENEHNIGRVMGDGKTLLASICRLPSARASSETHGDGWLS